MQSHVEILLTYIVIKSTKKCDDYLVSGEFFLILHNIIPLSFNTNIHDQHHHL
jgi:hypothetical protein